MILVDSSDAAPTAQAVSAFATYQKLLPKELAKWAALKKSDIPALNALLRERQLPLIKE